MAIRLCLRAALVGLLATAASAQTVDAPADPVTNVQLPEKVVLLPSTPVVQIGNQETAVCSAFFVGSGGTKGDENLFVSAGHCFFDTGIAPGDFKLLPVGNKPSVSGPGGLLSMHLVAASDPTGGLDDWAVFRATDPLPDKWKPVELDCSYTFHTGDEVTALGFPAANGGLTEMRGFVNGPSRRIGGLFPLVPVTMAVSGGASGSPVFEPDGRVVGILVSMNQSQPAWSYVQPLKEVCVVLHLI